MQKPLDKDLWLTRVDAVLKGAAFDADQALQGRIAGPAASRGEHRPWQIFTRVDSPVLAQAALQAAEDAERGADGLILTAADHAIALEELPLHRISLRNEGGDLGAEALRMLVSKTPVDPARLAIDFGCSDMHMAKHLRVEGFAGPYMRGDGRPFHMQGCTDAQELGAALAQAVAFLRKLEFLDDGALARGVSVTLAATQDMFATLAKFRAARILWRSVLAGARLSDVPLALHAETSRLMMATVDAHTNILRGVAAVFGAGLGGADSICALPFSAEQGVPNSFARRVARNMQFMLLHESHLWRVDDPAAGAGALERQTASICTQTWDVLQAAERGNWPTGDATQSPVLPKIGVSVYKPPKDFAPEVEAAS